MKTYRLKFIFLVPLLAHSSYAEEYAVISNKNIDALSITEIRDIFLKKISYVNDIKVLPINLGPRDKIRISFEENVLRLKLSKLKSYWTQQHYLGHRPPMTLKSENIIKAFVQKVDGAIGYINMQNVDENVHVVYTWADEYIQNEYKLGEGIQVGSLPFYLGGYFSLDYKHTDTIDRYRIDELSMMGYGSYKKFSYLAEFEFEDFYVQTRTQDTSSITQDTKLNIERLYVDYTLDENSDEKYIFRIGKYNSPIGFWNLLPIDVLRDTTSNPITSSIIFPRYTTGIGATYNSYGDANFQINLLAQRSPNLDASNTKNEIDEHYGVGVTYSKENLSLKVNAGVFNLIHDNLRYYALVSARYDGDNFQLMSELGTQASQTEFTTEYAGYIQGKYSFTNEHSVILRTESYKENVRDTSDNIAIIGYDYRPIYPISIKTEYQFHSQSKNDNFQLSFSMMF